MSKAAADHRTMFITNADESIALDSMHREQIRIPSKAGYTQSIASLTNEELIEHLRSVDSRVVLAMRMAELFGGDVLGAEILVIGASEGAESACLLGHGAKRIVGTNYGEVFGLAHAATVREEIFNVACDAHSVLHWCAVDRDRANFVIDDATQSTLGDATVDLVMSWQTLEHIPDVGACMQETARVLRPGGLAFHEYNPFFSIDGGHRACTLDMPWGHVRLSDAEVERFLRERRPDEAEAAFGFFRDALHRATQEEVRAAAMAADLEICAWLPRTRTEDALLLTPEIYAQAKRNHKSVEVIDLVSRIVRCVLRRPG